MWTLSLIWLLAALSSSIAYAQGSPPTGVDSPMGSIMCDIVSIMFGNFGRALATLGIIIVGMAATLGKVTWGMALTVAVGIGATFGSAHIFLKLLRYLPAQAVCAGWGF